MSRFIAASTIALLLLIMPGCTKPADEPADSTTSADPAPTIAGLPSDSSSVPSRPRSDGRKSVTPGHCTRQRREHPRGYPPADMLAADADRHEPFGKLSIFYPMWNEELYVERALFVGARACERLVASGDIGDFRCDL